MSPERFVKGESERTPKISVDPRSLLGIRASSGVQSTQHHPQVP